MRVGVAPGASQHSSGVFPWCCLWGGGVVRVPSSLTHCATAATTTTTFYITTVLLTSRARREVRYRVDAADIVLGEGGGLPNGSGEGRLHQGRDCTVFCQQLCPLLHVWGPSSAPLVA